MKFMDMFRASPPAPVTVNAADSFANMVAMIGGASGKGAGDTYIVVPEDQYTIDNAYRASPFFRKIVDTRPRDAVRRWRQWNAEADQVEFIENEEKRLNVIGNVLKAITMQRKYGGAVILALGLPGTNGKPLNVSNIRRGALRRLIVLSRYDVTLQDFITDPLSEFYGYPGKVALTSQAGQSEYIHPSRCVFFRNANAVTARDPDAFWGDSLWQTLSASVKAVDSSSAIIADLMREAKVDVIQVPGLFEKMATDKGTEAFTRRFTLGNMLKSINNALLLDKDDEWSQKTINWSGLPEVVQIQMQLLCGASGYTMTRLFGIQAKGLSNDGTADLKQYYDDVQQEQELDITPALNRLDDWIIRSALGDRDPAIWYQWRSLWQMTEKERAEIDKMQAETLDKLVGTALFDPAVIAKTAEARMIESGSWPGLEAALEEVGNNPENDLPDDEVQSGVNDAAPAPLYVRRNVINSAEILKWAKAQGFKTTLPASDLHVTITSSREPVDWLKMGESWSGNGSGEITINAGGPRIMEKFGEARVLAFASTDLQWRHMAMRERGASWDHDEYTPHITISYDPDSPDIAAIEPYRGKIVLGPEIFEATKEDWQSGVKEV